MCLRKGRQQDQCQKTCRRCDKRHHQSICPRNANSSNNNNNNAQNTERPLNSDRSTQERPRDHTINDRENTGITTATTTNRESSKLNYRVLLQTAKAVATNEDGTTSTMVRLLFDSGSQHSYITENLQAKLHLKSLQTERLNLNTFGEVKYKKQNCDVVKLQVRKSGCEDSINISALTFPVICSPLPSKVSKLPAFGWIGASG